eukprot:14224197-Alexandrium_andersonii.AAC.1
MQRWMQVSAPAGGAAPAFLATCGVFTKISQVAAGAPLLGAWLCKVQSARTCLRGPQRPRSL